MRKRKGSILFAVMFALSHLFAVPIYAEDLNDSEVTTEEYLLEAPTTYNANVKPVGVNYDQARAEMRRGIFNLEDEINFERFKIPTDDLPDIYFEMLAEHPEFYYITGLTWSSDHRGIVTTIRPEYTGNKTEIKAKIKTLNSKIAKILNSIIKPSMNEFEKELAIHDYIVLNTKYDEENYYKGTIPADSYTAYGVLIKGTGVCQGYAEAMKLLLNRVGIDCIIVSAPEMNHAWNIVTIDGVDYHVDATWNDPVPDTEGYVRYKYLNVSDAEMKKSHRWDTRKYPKCKSEKYSFLWDLTSPKYIGSTMYYADQESDIYQLDLKTFAKKKIPNVQARSIETAGDWIYFGNYADRGNLYKMRADGNSLTRLNDAFTGDIYFRDGYIYYTELDTGIEKSIKADVKPEVETPVTPGFTEIPEAPAMKKGWERDNSGDWYYYNNQGVVQTDWTKAGNTWYYMSSSGAMQTGWTQVDNTWYYMNSSGAMQTGWTKVGNTWYYMSRSGAMQTGWTRVGNAWYYMSGSGAMQTGWTQVGNTWYYMNSSGAMQTGWLKLGRNWYYLNSNGSMQTQSTRVNSRWYQFAPSGRML